MTAPAARLSRRHTISFGVGAIGNGVFVTVPGLLLLYYLTDVVGVAAGLASLALFVPIVLGRVRQPLGRVDFRPQHQQLRQAPPVPARRGHRYVNRLRR